MAEVIKLHAAAVGKRSGRKSDTGMPVRCATTGTRLPPILRAPVSHRFTVGRETPIDSANSSCESPRALRYSVMAEIALMPEEVPNRHSGCQAQSVGLVRDMISPSAYCTEMVTTDRPRGYLYIEERMGAFDPPFTDGPLAELCGVARQTVLRWKRPEEQHRINAGKMLLLADALQCEVPDLFLPPGQVTIAVDVAGAIAKRGTIHAKPLDRGSVRQPRRMRG